jgi:lysophospholipase L1-like esterase
MTNNIEKISVYGDSILKGAVTGTSSGHLFDIIENDSLSLAQKKLGFSLNNQSVFGNIITKGIRKLKKDLEKNSTGDLAIIESGGNDCDYDWNVVCENPSEKILPRVPLENFLATIGEMVDLCRENRITPLLMTMPPLVADRWFAHICRGYDAEKVRAFVGEGDGEVLYRNHEFYNANLLEFCLKKNVQFVDMRKKFLGSENFRSLMCQDGIHPNESGYVFMSKIWEEELPRVRNEFPS